MNAITNLEAFEAYCRAKGVIPFALAEIPNDGFYAEVRKGTANGKDFTQIGLKTANAVDLTGQPYKIDNTRFEWVRLGFADCNNQLILQ